VTDLPLTLTLRAVPGEYCLLTVDGEVDHHTAPQLRAALDRVPFAPGQLLVVDLARLTYCDSTGITALVTAHQQARAAGSSLTLAAVSPGLSRVLEIAGLDQLFSVRPTVADAIEVHLAQ